MLVVSGNYKGTPTVFVGLHAVDMRQLMQRQPIAIPVKFEDDEKDHSAQIMLFGGETQDSLERQVRELGAALFDADERSKN